MFYELYSESDVSRGGLWFDPENSEAIEVIDMESAAGDTGLTIIQKGSVYITEERLKRALESAGHFTLESPPAPPKGIHDWSPRHTTHPRPKPGQLFWTPEPSPGPRIMEAWGEWERLRDDEEVEFPTLPEEMRDDVLTGAEAMISYGGMEAFEGKTVIETSQEAKYKARRFDDAIISGNPELAVREILIEMGVDLPDIYLPDRP
jgi:hypothetical protein